MMKEIKIHIKIVFSMCGVATDGSSLKKWIGMLEVAISLIVVTSKKNAQLLNGMGSSGGSGIEFESCGI